MQGPKKGDRAFFSFSSCYSLESHHNLVQADLQLTIPLRAVSERLLVSTEAASAEEAATEGRKEDPAAAASGAAGAEARGEALAVIERLPACGTQEDADEFALAFCYVNSKGARRRLVQFTLLLILPPVVL